jgi:hypothetical protein
MRSAELKAASLVRCDEFTLRNDAEQPSAVGYLSGGGSFGENLAFGGGEARAPRPTLDSWHASPGDDRLNEGASWEGDRRLASVWRRQVHGEGTPTNGYFDERSCVTSSGNSPGSLPSVFKLI